MEFKPFEKKIWLASPTMHGDEQRWVADAFEKNWITTAGENVNECERMTQELIGCNYAVGLSCGTASLHLAIKLAGEKLYGQPKPNEGTLKGHKVFCADMTCDATINPVAYEDGEAVFMGGVFASAIVRCAVGGQYLQQLHFPFQRAGCLCRRPRTLHVVLSSCCP